MRLLFEDLRQWVEAEAEFRKALATLEKLATDYPAVPEYRSDLVGGWYDFACFFSLTSQKVVDNKQDYADRAMMMLHKAVKAGYNDYAHMAQDTDLDPLRDRADFKKLLESLQPKPKGKEPPRELAPPPRAVPNSGR